MHTLVNNALRCLAPACDCGPFSLDYVFGSHSYGSSRAVPVYDVLRDKHPPGCVADPALVLDVGKFRKFSSIF